MVWESWSDPIGPKTMKLIFEGFLEILPLRRASVKAKVFFDLHTSVCLLGAHGEARSSDRSGTPNQRNWARGQTGPRHATRGDVE